MAEYFNKLLLQGRALDEGIIKMEKIWSAPHIHIGRYVRFDTTEENFEETSKAIAAAEELSKSVIELKKSLFNDVKENEENLSEMRQLIDDSQVILDDLIQQCSDIETLFMENGYVPEIVKEENSSEFIDKNESTLENVGNLEVDSTPYIPWKSKLKTVNFSTPDVNKFSKPKEIKKEIKREISEDIETSLSDKLRTSRISYKSFGQSPQEPILSRYYYELIKKESLMN